MSRPYYADTSHYRSGIQSAYDAGLSYFPDVGTGLIPTPLGFDYTSFATDVGTGSAAAGPAGGVVGAAVSIFGQIAGGTAVDQARQARVNYFANLASQGNVAAMQLILGAPPNVSGNEQQMWVNAANALRSQAPDVYNAAEQAGPAWLVNSGDTATNYPAMRNYVQTWAQQHPFAAAAGAVAGAIGTFATPGPVPSYPGAAPRPGTYIVPPTAGAVSPLLLYGALAAGAYFLMSRRRRS